MTEAILHHYPVSPFAEKVRAMLGFKRLAWKSVQIPLIMPKPDAGGGKRRGRARNRRHRAGTVQVHFPRFGFQLTKAA